MNQPDIPPSRGLVAGKYELLQLIGKGGMGSVWEGRHSSLGTRVAIKFIEKEYADNEEARKRFDNEARAAAALQSKHAIQIYDHGVTDDGKPYIVMELLIGEPLDKRIERLRVIPLRDVAHIIQQVCRGLQKAHEHGIVHRDLKPENIFLVRNADDDDEVAKVLDFGIAKLRTSGADQNVSSSTRTGAVLGTPFYMSPEQARGLRDIDHRTDLWSMGVIAFKCATGCLPFEGQSLGDLLVKICTVPIPMPSQVNPQLPPSFDAWFSRALERDPNRRFGTATELADALAYASGLSVRRPQGMTNSPYGGPSAMQGSPGTPQPGTGTAMGGSPPPYAYGTPPAYSTQQPQYPMNITSPPFVASASPEQKSSKGLFIFAAFAAILGVGLALWGAKHIIDSHEETTTVATATQHTDPAPPTAVVVTALTTTPTATVAGTAPTATVTSTATAHPTATTTHGPITHPTANPTGAVTYTAVPTATATAHPTATATSRPGDFGAGF